LLRFLQDDIVRDDLVKGVDLQQYSKGIETQLSEAEYASILDYVKHSDILAQSHFQLKSFDTVLEEIQTMLSGFQSHLGNISSEIKTLQESSLQMNSQLKNRREAKGRLNRFMEGISLPPELVSGICEQEIDENFIDLLMMLNAKATFLEIPANVTSRAAEDVLPALRELVLQAVARVREFLMNHIYALQTPKTNVQIKQGVLCKFKYFYEFLSEKDPKTAQEVRLYYIDIMSKIYLAAFRKYNMEILALMNKDFVVDRFDLLGAEIDKIGGLFASKKFESHVIKVFELGERAKCIGSEVDQEMRLHLAAQKKEKLFFEEIFAGMLRKLMNSTISESSFVSEFFSQKKYLNEVIGKTISSFMEQVEAYIDNCFDPVSLLIMIRVLQEGQIYMSKANVIGLDSTLDKINIRLWPRFKSLIDANIESLTKFSEGDFGKLRRKFVFFVTRRYAEFSTALNALNFNQTDDSLLLSLRRLRNEIEKILMASVSKIENVKERSIFLINNFDIILRLFKSRNIVGEDNARFEELATNQVSVYADEELAASSVFGRLVSFVKATEFLLTSGDAKEAVNIDEAVVSGIIMDFKATWQNGLETLSEIVTRNFAPEHWTRVYEEMRRKPEEPDSKWNSITFATAVHTLPADLQETHREILKKVLTQFLSYYQKFQQLVQLINLPPAVSKEVIPRQTIIYEVKKYGKKEK